MWNGNRHNSGFVHGEDADNDLKQYIRDVPNFPKEGILFRDITPLLKTPKIFKDVIDRVAHRFAGEDVNLVACMESRGFLLGAPVAHQLGAGLIPVRKGGKLPRETVSEQYGLEYGTDCLEMHNDSIRPGQRVLIVDDVLATGGTARSVINMVEKLGGKVVCCVFLIELEVLGGRKLLFPSNVYSMLQY